MIFKAWRIVLDIDKAKVVLYKKNRRKVNRGKIRIVIFRVPARPQKKFFR